MRALRLSLCLRSSYALSLPLFCAAGAGCLLSKHAPFRQHQHTAHGRYSGEATKRLADTSGACCLLANPASFCSAAILTCAFCRCCLLPHAANLCFLFVLVLFVFGFLVMWHSIWLSSCVVVLVLLVLVGCGNCKPLHGKDTHTHADTRRHTHA